MYIASRATMHIATRLQAGVDPSAIEEAEHTLVHARIAAAERAKARRISPTCRVCRIWQARLVSPHVTLWQAAAVQEANDLRCQLHEVQC